MEMKNLEYIQLHIGYTFKNRGLLCQAFTRKSYTEENKNALHNEVLEFYGDKALDFIVMKKMSEYYGHIGAGELFSSSLDEGKLTEIKKKLVCREMLASKIRQLELHVPGRLLMGQGDIEQEIWKQESVQEDLFEAILGAVAIDSDWNVDALTKVVDRMLNPGFYFENGFGDEIDYMQLVQQWHQKKYGQPLKCIVIPDPFSTPLLLEYRNRFGEKITHYRCRIICPPFDEEALGVTKKEAVANAAQKVYEKLEKKHLLYSLRDEIGAPNIDRAINQLQELYQKGYISEPQYEFSETHDADGNPIWECFCALESLYRRTVGKDASKKQAKKIAAYKMVWLYLGEVEHDET